MSDKAIYTIELNDRLSPGLKKAVSASMGLDKQMGKNRASMGKSSKGLGMLSGAFTKLAGPIALAAAAMKAFNIASESVKIARTFETLENSINFASGSAQEGAKNLKFLRDQAKTLGLPLQESAEGFKTLAASMMGSKLQGDPTREIFKSVSIAASAMGLSAEDAKGTFLALGQIMGKGKVQAEELRGQIGERIPGAFNIAAKAMGVTQAQLNKLMDDGKLVAEDFLPKFAKELKNTFAGALPKAMNSSQAQLNRFNNMWLTLKLRLGRAVLPILNKVMGSITKLMDFLKIHKAFIISNIVNPLMELFNIYKNAYREIFNELIGGFSSSASAGDMFRGIVIGIGKALKFMIPIVKVLAKVMSFMWKTIIKAWKFSAKIAISIWKFAFANIALVVENIRLRFLGLKDIIQGALSLDKDQIAKGVATYATAGKKAAQTYTNIMNKDITPNSLFSAAANQIGLAGAAANPNKATGLEVFNVFKSLARNTPGAKGGTSTTATGAGGTKATSTSVDGIKSGRPTHINIDIGKLIENMNITASNVDDLTGQIKDQVAQALFSAVNNVNNIAGV
jgi:tape measure domain-containing protein